VAIVVPALFGGRAERVYRDSIAQLGSTGRALRLDSYHRGWFSSQATVSLTAGRGAITFVQHVHHGPLGFYKGWHIAFPVAAVVDTDPPQALQTNLDRFFGDAPIVITTVVGLGGALDTYITRASSERSDAAQKFTARFHGFDAEIHLSQEAYFVRGDAPGFTAAGGFGEAGMAGLTIRGESHRHSSGLWLGDKALKIARASYSVVASGVHPAASGLVQDIALAGRSRVNNGRLEVRDSLSIGKIAAGTLILGPLSLAAEFGNLPLAPIEQFMKALSSIPQPASGQPAQAQMLQQKLLELFAATIKESPILTIELRAASPGGDGAGKATFGISPDLANDPLLKPHNPAPKGVVAQAWNKYGHAAVDLAAPPGFLAQVTKPAQLQQLEQSGILVRDGANYVCRATFKNGGWMVNGRKIKLPARPPRPDLSSHRS
jgi:uncharacterized protein YdgA (DUF945 family)